MYTDFAAPSNSFEKVYSITEISNLLKGVVENQFTGLKVRGELSSVKRHTSGHLYFTLKDEGAVLDGVCWKGNASKLMVEPQDGLDVICRGRLTTYPGRSKYQMVVESLELAGEGALLKLLIALREKLAAEGLFREDRKKPLPFLPQTIGVITSLTGAVIRDILHRIDDRFPLHVLVWPVAVQGEGSAQQIVTAIQGFNSLAPNGPIPRPDVLIVARGGGSLEDLWSFNEESVVRAAAASQIPLISAVGHETDTTLIDYAADHRAPTPTAAAERAVPVRADLVRSIVDKSMRVHQSLRRLLEEKMQRLDERADRLDRSLKQHISTLAEKLARLHVRSPRDLVTQQLQRLESLTERLALACYTYLHTRHTHVRHYSQLLQSYSYTRVLERGFCVLKGPTNQILRSVTQVKKGDDLHLEMADGSVQVAAL